MTSVRVRAVGQGLLLLLLQAAACGGHTEGGSDEPREPTAPSGQGAPNDSNAAPSGVEGDTELGACSLGSPVLEASGKPCAWLADDRCYDTREMACNCVCPRTRDSQCSSGFDDGPDGHVWVECR